MKFVSALSLVSAILLAVTPINAALVNGNAFVPDNSSLAETKGTYIVKPRSSTDIKQFFAQTNSFAGGKKTYRHTYDSKVFQGA
jgi:hypothetical protein